jgi:hypothetical protein
MSLYRIQADDDSSYGFYDGGNSITYFPGAGASIEAVIEHERVHARLVEFSSLGFLQQAARAAAVTGIIERKLNNTERLRGYARAIYIASRQVHETAAWTMTATLPIMRSSNFGQLDRNAGIPPVPEVYKAGVRLTEELYLTSGAIRMQEDGSIPSGIHPMNYAYLVQVMAIWALSPPNLLEILNLPADKIGESLQKFLSASENQPTQRFLSLFGWAYSLEPEAMERLFHKMDDARGWQHCPIPVEGRHEVGGEEWLRVLSLLDSTINWDAYSKSPNYAISANVGVYLDIIDPYIQVRVEQPKRLGTVPPSKWHLVERLNDSMICQISREASHLDIVNLGNTSLYPEDECKVSIYNVRAQRATGFKCEASEVPTMLNADVKNAMGSRSAQLYVAVSSNGYNFYRGDFEGYSIMRDTPHTVVAKMSFRDLWGRILIDGGLEGSHEIECLVVSSGLPDEYSFVVLKAKGAARRIAVINALPTVAVERAIAYANSGSQIQKGAPHLVRVFQRLVDWIPELAGCITATWCLWEGWIPFYEINLQDPND